MTPPLTDAELSALAEYLGHVPVNTPERAELYGKIPRLFAEVKAGRAKQELKTRHDGDCEIYAAEVQLCTCGYLHQWMAVDLQDDEAVKRMDKETGKEVESRRVLSCHYHPEAHDTPQTPFGYVVAWTDARRKPSFHYDRLTASKALLGEIGFGSGKVVDVYERKESLQP